MLTEHGNSSEAGEGSRDGPPPLLPLNWSNSLVGRHPVPEKDAV